jgi:hypothetical protein
LETLEKETLAKARTFVRNPIRLSRRSLTQDRLAASLRSLGVAGRGEIERLERRISTLEKELRELYSALAEAVSTGKPSALKSIARPRPETDSFPNT